MWPVEEAGLCSEAEGASHLSADAPSQQLLDQAVQCFTTATKLTVRIPAVAAKLAFLHKDAARVLIYHTAKSFRERLNIGKVVHSPKRLSLLCSVFVKIKRC